MPEGDSVRRVADRLGRELVGRSVVVADLRVPRHATADLRGARVLESRSWGKHLLLRLALPGEERLTLHSHLRMDGSWTVLGAGRRLPRHLDHQVRAVLTLDDSRSAVALAMPVLDLLPTDRESEVTGHLGPDLLGEPGTRPFDWDEAEALRRFAATEDRPAVEALLDQRLVAGIGNLWAVETLYLRGVNPWTPVHDVELPRLLHLARRMMTYALTHPAQVTTGDTRPGRTHWVYGRAGQPCRRCGTAIEARDATGRPYERETWWCPSCQPGTAPTLTERPWRAGLRRGLPTPTTGGR